MKVRVGDRLVWQLDNPGTIGEGVCGLTGEELKNARKRKVLTQRQLGELLGYEGRSAETTVQCWEYNKAPIPLKHFRKLSEILEVPLDKFIP
jgi:transcriptional regulator with XRE-family HTH domain